MSTDRYARQRLIEGWDQERLQQARVLVAGVGAIGNEVIKNLALLGVGHLLLVDFDRIEQSNLSRSVLFSDADVGRCKVEAAAEAVARLNPDVQVRTIAGDLHHDVGLGFFRHSDLVIGCLDNLGARSQLGLSCTLAGTPHLDGGMWSLGGEVRWFFAGDGPCFECTLSLDDWQRINERRSCTGFGDPDFIEPGQVPTMATTSSIIGGLLAQEAVKLLCGYPISRGKAIVFNGQNLTLHRAELARNPDCRNGHTAYSQVIELPERASGISGRQLLALARSAHEAQDGEPILQLGGDFLLGLHCPACGNSREINRHWCRVAELEATCPHCGGTCLAEAIHDLDEQSRHIDKTLDQLGVAPAEVLAVVTARGLMLYELSGDLGSWARELEARPRIWHDRKQAEGS